jgi:hypothetical protein
MSYGMKKGELVTGAKRSIVEDKGSRQVSSVL